MTWVPADQGAAIFVADWQCSVASENQPCSTEPADLLAKPIDGFQAVVGSVLVPYQRIDNMDDRQFIVFMFRPVRGRSAKFKFRKANLIHPF